MTLSKRHALIVSLSLLLFIGDVARAVRLASIAGAYNGDRTGEAILEEKAERTPAQQKISSRLLDAVKIYRGGAGDSMDLMRRSGVEVDVNGTTIVDIKARVTDEVVTQIEALGGTVMNSFPQYQAIRARVPLGEVEALAEMPEVIFIRPADQAITN